MAFLPAQDGEWSPLDMEQVVTVLTTLAKEGYQRLPRAESERSGLVFARMTSPQNFELYRNRTIPLEARMPLAVQHLGGLSQLTKLYLAGFLKREVRDRELIELLGASSRLTVVMLGLVDEFLPTIKINDPRNLARREGMEQFKRGLAGVVAGGLQTLSEREFYQKDELERLITYMQETYPIIVPRLPPGSRSESVLRLERMQTNPAFRDLQPGLGKLAAQVKAAVEDHPDSAP